MFFIYKMIINKKINKQKNKRIKQIIIITYDTNNI